MVDHDRGGSYRPRPHDVTHERLDGEVIAVHLGSGCYYSMVGSAADVWWLICQGAPRDMWIALLRSVFPNDDIDDASLEAFAEECRAAELVVAASDAPTGPFDLPPPDYQRGPWSAPRLEEFTDLRDLILVDPVHDTTDDGWPHLGDRNS